MSKVFELGGRSPRLVKRALSSYLPSRSSSISLDNVALYAIHASAYITSLKGNFITCSKRLFVLLLWMSQAGLQEIKNPKSFANCSSRSKWSFQSQLKGRLKKATYNLTLNCNKEFQSTFF